MKSLAFVAALVDSPAFADMKIEIPFEAQIGGQPLSCAASYADIGTTKSAVQVADFRVYVSNFRMIGADGSEVPVARDNDGTLYARRLGRHTVRRAGQLCQWRPVSRHSAQSLIGDGLYAERHGKGRRYRLSAKPYG